MTWARGSDRGVIGIGPLNLCQVMDNNMEMNTENDKKPGKHVDLGRTT